MKICVMIYKAIKFIVILSIKIYKSCISPLLPCACRFQPTCSQYMIEAIEEYGIIKGIYLGIKRIFRCHPWGGSGYDPVPRKKKHSKGADYPL